MESRTINLSALAVRLRSEKRYLRLAGLIDKAVNVGSLHSDMMMAAESMVALRSVLAIPTEPNDHKKLITESALLNNAIMLYVRATKTKSKIRAGFDLRSKFSQQEVVVHQELCDIRDDAIAHFGLGGSYGGEWQAEVAILQFEGDGGLPAVLTRRQTIDRTLCERVESQIEIARSMLRKIYYEILQKVVDEIGAAAKADSNFHLELSKHPLNLDLFLQSKAAAAAVRESRVPGRYAMGSVGHK